MVDDGCIGGSALAVNRSYLATGSSEGVVNIYNLAAATSQPHPKPDKVRYIVSGFSIPDHASRGQKNVPNATFTLETFKRFKNLAAALLQWEGSGMTWKVGFGSDIQIIGMH
jgi:hypothetical protein